MSESTEMVKARSIVKSAMGQQINSKERAEQSVTLAALLLTEAIKHQTSAERRLQAELARMMDDPIGKVFTASMTDQCFRSDVPKHVADQMVYLIDRYGVPSFLSMDKKIQLQAFKLLGRTIPWILVPLAKRMLRKQTATVILPGEDKPLIAHMNRRREEGVRVNLNHLGEAILGEEEAAKRLRTYLEDLAKPEVEYISVKISTIFSQINLLAWPQTVESIAKGLRQLYRAAEQHRFRRADGTLVPKFVNLDMEEYRDLHLTVELFQKVLDEPEFFKHASGIVLQSYLPDAHCLQVVLTEWAIKRVKAGGAPIKIRIVKGANLAMEQVEASVRGWPQAPYDRKADVDANFKRMVEYGCLPENARAANLGIGSHNLFDIAYALLLRSQHGVEQFVCFEMLEGMADHVRRVVQQIAGDMLLYCPAATKEEFQNAVAYLVRRLDENTAPENFLRHLFELTPGTPVWDRQVKLFTDACLHAPLASKVPRRYQDRREECATLPLSAPFDNESDTDWSLPQNRQWVGAVVEKWKQKTDIQVPVVIGGKRFPPDADHSRIGYDPSIPGKVLYRYRIADSTQVEQALQIAKIAEPAWQATSVEERARLLSLSAEGLRRKRGDLIGVMMADTGKTAPESDPEISEAIDFAEYYARAILEWGSLPDIEIRAKGTALVAPPWNFPCSIPFGSIASALAAGNCVIFKPAQEAVLVGWELVNILWESGFSQQVVQFLPCLDEPTGSQLVRDPRVDFVVLTGATDTARLLLRLRPGLDLIAETGGKNAIIVTASADRDLAAKEIVQSAFGHAGQKCSACSLAILEAEVYDDPLFMKQLKDAAASFKVGSAWDPSTRVNPLIRVPNDILKRGLTSLDPGETWLLEPRQNPNNPSLWSPGIKLGVRPGSFTFSNELFGPVLGLVRADNLKQAIKMVNSGQYGLTSGIHSLDEREQRLWTDRIEAGNCYINRGITGAVVRRQPFGGCKESSFGRGSKAGGPNYLMQMVHVEQKSLPTERELWHSVVAGLDHYVSYGPFSTELKELWKASLGSYSYYMRNYFSKDHDPSRLVGQDNIFRYRPQSHTMLRIQEGDNGIDVLRVCAASMIAGTHLLVSGTEEALARLGASAWGSDSKLLSVTTETDQQFLNRIKKSSGMRLRLLSKPSKALDLAAADSGCRLLTGSVLANGRLELLHYLREIAISNDYHRYGNLGSRENESRSPLPGTQETQRANVSPQSCGPQCCCVQKKSKS